MSENDRRDLEALVAGGFISAACGWPGFVGSLIGWFIWVKYVRGFLGNRHE